MLEQIQILKDISTEIDLNKFYVISTHRGDYIKLQGDYDSNFIVQIRKVFPDIELIVDECGYTRGEVNYQNIVDFRIILT